LHGVSQFKKHHSQNTKWGCTKTRSQRGEKKTKTSADTETSAAREKRKAIIINSEKTRGGGGGEEGKVTSYQSPRPKEKYVKDYHTILHDNKKKSGRGEKKGVMKKGVFSESNKKK